MIGQTISHYRILEKIGEGGMGIVYKAEDIALNRPVALKILPPELLSEPSRKERFIQEAQAASAINHPNIAQVHELGEHEGIHFITMEYIEGKTLHQLAKPKKLKLEKLVEIMIQVTDALTKAHKKKIVHRDLKPENIMVNEDGLAKVLDFGLAKLIEKTVSEDQLSKVSTKAITESGVGTVIGTPFYMSPEQAKGESVDHRSDIFSIGTVMYEMASGVRPFQGDSNVEVLSSILKEEPKPVSEINEKVPYQLQHIIHKALAKRRDDRYQTIKDMWVDLREVKRDLETGSSPVISDVKGVSKVPASKKTWVWTIAGIVGLLVILVGAYFLFKGKIPTGISKKPTVAVYWFENISGDAEEEYFSEGITEELITELWKIGGLKVNTRDDIRPYKSQPISAKEFGQQLSFNYGLTGSIQKMADKVRVTPRLIDAATGTLIWTSRYDDVFNNIFELQDTIAFQIARQLQVQLSKEEKQKVSAVPTESQEAYDHYLKGRHYYYRTTFRDNDLAVKEFQKALQLDPDYSLALAGLADAYVQRYKERYDYDEIWLDEAEELIEKALELEPDLAEAYESKAELFLAEENYSRALEAAEKARKLQPQSDEPYLHLGSIYSYRGERRKALEMFDKALSLRLSVEALCGKGEIYEYRGDLDKAEDSFRSAMKLNPDHDRPYIRLGWLKEQSHQLQEAEKFYRKAIEVRPDKQTGYYGLIDILEKTGSIKEAEEISRSFVEKFPYHWDAYELLYDFLAWTKGDYAAAMEVIEEAARQNPERIWPQIFLSWSYAYGMDKKPEPEKALKSLERALSLRPESSRVLESAGDVHIALGNKEEALKYLNQALEINPGKRGVLWSIVSLFCWQADYEKAVEYAMQSIEQAPGRYSWSLYQLLENSMVELGKSEEFLLIVEKAAQKYGQDDPNFLRELCRQKRIAGRMKEAASTCNKALALKEDPLTLYEEGVTHFLSGNYDAALSSFRKAKGWVSGYSIISVLKFRGEFKQIEEYLNKIRIPSPDEISGMDYWFWLACEYYMDMRRFDDALNVANEALKSNEVTWTEDLKIKIAALHRAKGNMDHAKDLLKEITDTAPANYKSYASQELAIIKAIQGDLVAAVEFTKRALAERIHTDKKEPVLELQARFQYALGNKKEALRLIREAKGSRGRASSSDLIPLYRRAQFELIAGSQNAQQYLNKALFRAARLVRGENWYSAMDGVVASYYALILAHSGKSQEAIREIKRAMQLEPELAEVAYYATCVFSLVGDTEKALDWFQTAVDRGYQELWWARVDADLDPLRDNPRFNKIMKDWDARIRALFD